MNITKTIIDMNRPIKFRALRDDISDCSFKYGSIIHMADGTPRIVAEVDDDTWQITYFTCLKGTEGQFTGLIDRNGKEIYEGDIDATGIEIKWDEIAASFICVRDGNFVDHLGEVSSLLLITGNIHECRT